mgnify:FL=1
MINYHNYFGYDGSKLIHKLKRKRSAIGDGAESLNVSGYKTVWVENKNHLAHRVIWVLVNGDIPDGMQIDHINGIRADNRISNLRLVFPKDNQRNLKLYANNSTGVAGVRFNGYSYIAEVAGDYLGSFDQLTAAATTANEYRKMKGFHANHGRIE